MLNWWRRAYEPEPRTEGPEKEEDTLSPFPPEEFIPMLHQDLLILPDGRFLPAFPDLHMDAYHLYKKTMVAEGKAAEPLFNMVLVTRGHGDKIRVRSMQPHMSPGQVKFLKRYLSTSDRKRKIRYEDPTGEYKFKYDNQFLDFLVTSRAASRRRAVVEMPKGALIYPRGKTLDVFYADHYQIWQKEWLKAVDEGSPEGDERFTPWERMLRLSVYPEKEDRVVWIKTDTGITTEQQVSAMERFRHWPTYSTVEVWAWGKHIGSARSHKELSSVLGKIPKGPYADQRTPVQKSKVAAWRRPPDQPHFPLGKAPLPKSYLIYPDGEAVQVSYAEHLPTYNRLALNHLDAEGEPIRFASMLRLSVYDTEAFPDEKEVHIKTGSFITDAQAAFILDALKEWPPKSCPVKVYGPYASFYPQSYQEFVDDINHLRDTDTSHAASQNRRGDRIQPVPKAADMPEDILIYPDGGAVKVSFAEHKHVWEDRYTFSKEGSHDDVPWENMLRLSVWPSNDIRVFWVKTQGEVTLAQVQVVLDALKAWPKKSRGEVWGGDHKEGVAYNYQEFSRLVHELPLRASS